MFTKCSAMSGPPGRRRRHLCFATRAFASVTMRRHSGPRYGRVGRSPAAVTCVGPGPWLTHSFRGWGLPCRGSMRQNKPRSARGTSWANSLCRSILSLHIPFGRCSLLERWPRRGGGGNLLATAGAVYCGPYFISLSNCRASPGVSIPPTEWSGTRAASWASMGYPSTNCDARPNPFTTASSRA